MSWDRAYQWNIDSYGTLIEGNVYEKEKIPAGVKRIGVYALSKSERLVSISVPEGCTELETGAFAWCHKLEHVSLPSTLKRIDFVAFENCEKLREIILPSGIKEIGAGAFRGSGLERIELPAHLEKELDLPFEDCRHLTQIVWPYGPGSIRWNTTAFGGEVVRNKNLRIYANNIDPSILDGHHIDTAIQKAIFRGFEEQYLKGNLPDAFPLKAWIEALAKNEDLNAAEIVILVLEKVLPLERITDAVVLAQMKEDPALTAWILEVQNSVLGTVNGRDIDRLYQEAFGCPIPA